MRRIPEGEVAGALMWVSTMTDPDVVSAFRTVAVVGDNPG